MSPVLALPYQPKTEAYQKKADIHKRQEAHLRPLPFQIHIGMVPRLTGLKVSQFGTFHEPKRLQFQLFRVSHTSRPQKYIRKADVVQWRETHVRSLSLSIRFRNVPTGKGSRWVSWGPVTGFKGLKLKDYRPVPAVVC